MKCPYCGDVNSKVIDSRSTDEGVAIRRRRECLRQTVYHLRKGGEYANHGNQKG